MRDNDDITQEIMEAGLASALAKLGGRAVAGAAKGVAKAGTWAAKGAANAAVNSRAGQRTVGTIQGAKAYNQIKADWNRWAGSQGGLRGVAPTPQNLMKFTQDVYNEDGSTILAPLMREYLGTVDVDGDGEPDVTPAKPTFGKRTTPPGQQPAAAAGAGAPPNPPAAPASAAPAAAASAAAPKAPAAAQAAPEAPEAPAEPAAPKPKKKAAPKPKKAAEPKAAEPKAAEPKAAEPKAAEPETADAAAEPESEPEAAPMQPPLSFGRRGSFKADGTPVSPDRIVRNHPDTGKPFYRHNSGGIDFKDPTLNATDKKLTAKERDAIQKRQRERELAYGIGRTPRTESVINPIGLTFSQIIAEAPSTVSLDDIARGRARGTDARNKEVFRQRDAAAKAEKSEIAKNDAAIRQNMQSLADEYFKALARRVTGSTQSYRAFMGKDYTGHAQYGSPSKLGTGAPTTAQDQAQYRTNINRGAVNSILLHQFGMDPDALTKVRDAIKDMSPKQAEQWMMTHQNNRLAAQVLVALLKSTEKR